MNFQQQPSRQAVFIFCILGAVFLFGCDEQGNRDQEITLQAIPGSLALDSSNRAFLVEVLTHSVLIGDIDGDAIDWSGQLYKEDWSFVPWGVDVGRQEPNDILFIAGNDSVLVELPLSKVLALPAWDPIAQEPNEHGNYNILKALTGISDEEPFTLLRAVASLTLDAAEGIIRVFIIDDTRIAVFNFDYNDVTPAASEFLWQYTISSFGAASPCTGEETDPNAFAKPYGLAVDPDQQALYVSDLTLNKIYRFSGISGSSATCDGEVLVWGGDPEESLSEPSGVAVLSGQTPASNNLIYVSDANSRVVAFQWDGTRFVWHHTASLSDKKPFDLAFDSEDNLWITYPETYEYEQVNEGSP